MSGIASLAGRRSRSAVIAWVLAALVAGCGGSGSTTSQASSPGPSAVTASSTPDNATAAASAAPPTPGASVDLAAARSAFDYDVAKPSFVEVATTTKDGVTVSDVTYASVGGRTVSALLVAPAGGSHHPVILFLHWYATSEPDGNRTEFLAEATRLAARGVVSLLPEQQFPWHQPPAGTAEDHQAVIDQVVDDRVGLDALVALPGVDPKRVGVVGHDFGAMYAALVAGLDDRVGATVIMAGVPHFADWYLRYWHPVAASEQATYKATMLEVDPVTFLPEAAGPVLFQFAESDQYVKQAAIDAWIAAAPGDASVKTYNWNHSLRTDAAGADRDAFLAKALALAQ
jgi:dienelactone hydrolase